MKGRSRKFTAAIVAAALAMTIVPAVVVASIITNATAVAVKVTAALSSNTVTTFTGTSGPLNGLVTTCTKSTTGFTLASRGGLGPFTLTIPTFTGCTDNLGGTDTIKGKGTWTNTYVNSTGSPNPDQIKISIPQAGQTLVSSMAPSCTVTIQPSAAGSVLGSYDNLGHLTLTKQTVTYSASGTCLPATGTGNASFSTVLKSGGTGTPGYLVTPPVFGIH